VSGSFTVTSGAGSFSVSTTGVPAGGETFTIALHQSTIDGTVYGTSSTITIAAAPGTASIGAGWSIGPGWSVS
jgi:hypothetical protein